MLTADALHTQVALVAGVVAQGGDVVLMIKAKQPTPYANLAASIADPHTPALRPRPSTGGAGAWSSAGCA